MRAEFRTQGVKRPQGIRQLRIDLRGNFSNEVVLKGEKWARKYMPYYYGNLYRALRVVKNKQSAKLIQDQPRDGRHRPYHLWMHGIGKYDTRNHITSGNPRYMYDVLNVMRAESRKLVKQKSDKYLK